MTGQVAHAAKNGDIMPLVTASDSAGATTVANPAAGLLAPGETTTAIVNTNNATANTQLSVVAMLLPTNDGFLALNSLTVPTLPGTYTYNLNAYDAGTEANTESADTVPGPAASGLAEGFNADRDDVRNAVYVHPGVVTQDDGLTTSTLSGSQRWDNPMARVDIERLQ